MEFLKNPLVPWSLKHMIVRIALGKRCQLCDERVGSLCRIDDVYELRCVTCVKGLLDNQFPFPKPLEDDLVRDKWSFVACSIGSSLQELSSVSEED